MHQHYKAVFIGDIYNRNILTELTLSLVFAQGLSNYLSAPFFIQDALSVVRALFIHSHSKKSPITIQLGHLFSQLGRTPLPGGMEM